MMQDIQISIITACFNHGTYLEENIHSIQTYKWKIPVEHIIINDGSTDQFTIDKLAQLKAKGNNIIDQKNAGPANARNKGIAASSGKYILPLDADNKLRPAIFEKAFTLMEKEQNVAVVYTNAMCFGDMNYLWEPGEIDPYKFLVTNYLDTCSLIRKSELIEVGGYDDKIPVHGNEDWDLWLKMIFAGKGFYYLKEIGYEYRVLTNSLSRTESTPKQQIINEYIARKYAVEYAIHYSGLFSEKKKLENLKSFLKQHKLKSILKIILNKSLIDY